MPPPPSSSPPDALSAFGERLSSSLADGTFVRLILSQPRPGQDLPLKVLGRCIELKNQPHLSLTFRYPTRDEVHNFAVRESVGWVLNQLQASYQSALLGTTMRDWQLQMQPGKPGRLVRHSPSRTQPPSRRHDEESHKLLDDSARDWLTELGVLNPAGAIRPACSDKHRQISRYIEILSHLAKDCGWTRNQPPWSEGGDLVLADMGSGKGYLTFGAWQLFRRVLNLPARVIGIESRPDLVATTNRAAKQIGADGLEFVCGTIATVELPRIDGLFALHACDTATDNAIQRGIALGARLIVVAPCCHKQVRRQLQHPPPLAPLLRHGLLQERIAEWVTDGLRSLFLEWAGYQTKVFEFVSSEHTPKNLMISAVRSGPPFCSPDVRTQIEQLKTFFGIEEHALDALLSPAA